MRKLIGSGLLLALLASIFSTMAIAQENNNGAPPFLQVIREDVKPGKAAAHEKFEAGWPAAYTKANIKSYWVGGTPLAGASEAWFIVAYGSVGDIEDVNKQLAANKPLTAELDRLSAGDAEFVSNNRSLLLGYDAELSYRPDFNIGEYRYLMVDTYRVRPGHGQKFAEWRKAVNSAHEKVNMDEHMLVYGATLGAPAGTFYVFEPLKSLKEMDGMVKSHGPGSDYFQATGDEGRKRGQEFSANDVAMTERQIIVLSPHMSHVSAQAMAAAPDFWMPKSTMAKKANRDVTPAAKKETKK